MNIIKLFQSAAVFQKRAQEKGPDLDLRNKIINTRLGNNFSFREVAIVVMQALTAIDRNEADAGVTGANHSLLDILNTLSVPTASELMNAATQSLNIIREKTPNDSDNIRIAQYLVNLAKLLINKYLTKAPESVEPQPQQQQEEVKQEPQSVAKESPSLFLKRVYWDIVNGKQLSDEDVQEWKNYKTFYTRRLNGLNTITNKTPAQKSEQYVIKFVLNKLRNV